MSEGRREGAVERGGELRRPPQPAQVLGSVLGALAIAVIAIAVVTAHFGSTPVAEIEAREERLDAREDAREDREEAREEREEAREERQGPAAGRTEDNSGPG